MKHKNDPLFSRRKEKYGLSHSGFTIVELIVVISIAAILVGVTGLGISLAFSRDVEGCARDINLALETARLRTMSQTGDHQLVINMASPEPVIQFVTTLSDGTSSSETLYRLQRRVNVTFTSIGGTSDLTGRSTLTIVFNKSTGVINEVSTEAGPADGTVFEMQCTDGEKEATVILVASTGKHFIRFSS